MPSIALQTFDRVASVQGAVVEFVRGEQSVILTALVSRKEYTVRDSSGTLVQFSSHDFAVRADQLVLNGQTVEPRRGDVFRRIVGSRRQTFEAQHPNLQDTVYRWADPAGEVLRIHTGLVSSEVVT